MNRNISISTAKAASRLALLLLLLLGSAVAPRAVAQQMAASFQKEIRLAQRPYYTLQNISREMYRQSGITFSYNAARIKPGTRIKIKDKQQTVEKLLILIKKKSGIGYKTVSSNHIVYVEGPKKKGLLARIKELKKPQPRKVATPKISTAKAPAAPQIAGAMPIAAVPLRIDSLMPPGARLVIVGDSSVAMGYYFSGGSNSGGAYAGAITPPSAGQDGTPTKASSLPTAADAAGKESSENKPPNFFQKHLLVAGGLSVDEIYYFNPGVRLGFTFLYGTLSYNLGAAPHLRYGLGSSVSLDEKWNLHLAFNTGKNLLSNNNFITRDTIPPSFPDSMSGPTYVNKSHAILTTSRLSRLSLILEYQLSRSLALSAGATLNYLTTKYSSEGAAVSFSSFSNPVTEDPDKEFRVIKPPYLLSNSYDAGNPENNKFWIGFQLSLYYRIPFSK